VELVRARRVQDLAGAVEDRRERPDHHVRAAWREVGVIAFVFRSGRCQLAERFCCPNETPMLCGVEMFGQQREFVILFMPVVVDDQIPEAGEVSVEVTRFGGYVAELTKRIIDRQFLRHQFFNQVGGTVHAAAHLGVYDDMFDRFMCAESVGQLPEQ
jgi:hypothetical protein